MKFNNRENEQIVIKQESKFTKLVYKICGFFGIKSKSKIYWNSRAVAVVGTVCLIKNNIPYILISQRGEGAADYQGLWNLPCGYLDWDETTGEAFIREVWEECGVNTKQLLENKEVIRMNYVDYPWDFTSSTSENRQNVCIHHGFVGMVDELPVPEIRNEVEEGEVADVKWVSIFEYHNYKYAFNHEARIEKFIMKNMLDVFAKEQTK